MMGREVTPVPLYSSGEFLVRLQSLSGERCASIWHCLRMPGSQSRSDGESVRRTLALLDYYFQVLACNRIAIGLRGGGCSLTRSQARSLLSIARLKITRSRIDLAISSRTRIDHTCLGSRGFLLADEQSFAPRLLATIDGVCRYTQSSATEH